MTIKYLSGGALAALAAALAFTAVPASAQDWHDNNGRGHDRGAQHEDRGNRQSGDRHQERAAPAQRNWNNGAQQRTQTPAANQSRGQWTDRHVDRSAQQSPRQAGAFRGWGDGGRATTERNRTYVDPNRNQTYVARDRTTQYERRDNDRDWRNDRRDNDRNWRNDRRDNRTYRDARGNYQQWNRTWRNDNRYDWQRYRSYNRNAYHLRPYYSPYRNYSYRRLSIGFYLDPLFFGQDYRIGDPGYYRLPAVYGPYRWVRYYDDALLVNIYTGEVEDVIYDFFW